MGYSGFVWIQQGIITWKLLLTLANGENSSGPVFKYLIGLKQRLQTPYYARLVSDGVIVNGGDFDGGEIELTLEGLSAGKHTLVDIIHKSSRMATD